MLLPLFPVRSFLRTKKVEYGVSIIRAKRSHVTRLSCVTANTSYFNDSPELWNFSGNWWGSNDTQILKSKGDTANLRSIRDGRDKDTTGLGELSFPTSLRRNQRTAART
jgi:hypothetical protein